MQPWQRSFRAIWAAEFLAIAGFATTATEWIDPTAAAAAAAGIRMQDFAQGEEGAVF